MTVKELAVLEDEMYRVLEPDCPLLDATDFKALMESVPFQLRRQYKLPIKPSEITGSLSRGEAIRLEPTRLIKDAKKVHMQHMKDILKRPQSKFSIESSFANGGLLRLFCSTEGYLQNRENAQAALLALDEADDDEKKTALQTVVTLEKSSLRDQVIDYDKTREL